MIVNANSTGKHAIWIKNGIMINVTLIVESIARAKKKYSLNASTWICENKICSKVFELTQ